MSLQTTAVHTSKEVEPTLSHNKSYFVRPPTLSKVSTVFTCDGFVLKNCALLNLNGTILAPRKSNAASLRRSQSLTRMAYQEAAAVSFYCKDVSMVTHWKTLEDHVLSSSFGI